MQEPLPRIPGCFDQGTVQGAVQLRRINAALAVRRHRDGVSHAQIPQREIDRIMAFLPHQAADSRGTGKPGGVDVPAGFLQDAPACCRKAGEVGHRCTGDETDVGRFGQAQQVEEPMPGGRLDDRGGRRGSAEERILVPGTDQPVCRHGGGQGAADDPAEEAARGHGHEAGFRLGSKIIDHVTRRQAVLRHRAAEDGFQIPRRGPRPHTAGGLAFQPFTGMPGRGVQGVPEGFVPC